MSSLSRQNGLLALLAALLSLVLLVTRPSPPQDSDQPISLLQPDAIQRIELALGRAGGSRLQLQRDEQGWMLTAPVRMPADPIAVGEILRLASSRSDRQMPAQEADLGKLRLAPALWHISLNDTRFEVGGTEAISGRRYVRQGDTIYLVADLNAARLDNNYADLVARDLLPQDGEITALRLPDPINGSREISAQQDAHAPLLQRWLQAQAQWLVRPTRLDYQDVHERATVFVRDAGGSTRSIDFLIRSRSPQLELIRPDLDLMYMLPGSASDELLQPPDA